MPVAGCILMKRNIFNNISIFSRYNTYKIYDLYGIIKSEAPTIWRPCKNIMGADFCSLVNQVLTPPVAVAF